MIIFVLICTAILLAVVEMLSRRNDVRELLTEFSIDSTLTEPDERVLLRFSVQNNSRWPVLFAALTLQLDPGIQVCEEESWLSRHAQRDQADTRIRYHFCLPPGKKYSGRLRISCAHRGQYRIGRYYLLRSDYMGLDPLIRNGDMGLCLVCTAKRCRIPKPETLGGVMGEVPVRRFILDDPCMLKGYREYTGREPMKQISWMMTAKAGQLMVRQNDFIIDRNVSILLNMEEGAPKEELERCLELLRSVCEELEAQRVPYALFTNGDVFSLDEGLGRNHVLYIQRRIGLSRLISYFGFTMLVDQYLFRPREYSSCIVIAPRLNKCLRETLPRLQRCTGREPMLLCGGEAEP
ncbi:MAG: DUF58 domain-containing protein [Oscillospiraceae bacterium]|nr:DUF58 domain-containing protein [Oscillospiraceae bacterium]